MESESEEEIKVGVKRAGPSNVKAEPSAKMKAAAEDDVIEVAPVVEGADADLSPGEGLVDS